MGSVARAANSFNIKKIAIIGAGPSGLATAKFLLAEKCFETVDVFEQQSEVGGVWNYTPITGEKVPVPSTSPNVPLDKPIWPEGSKAPIFSNPMYEHLNTNIPKGIMGFSDLSFPSDSLLFPTRQDVQSYLVQYSQDIRHLISFSTQVDDVRLVGNGWELTSKSTISGESKKHNYDAIVVSSGHYSVPFIPSVTKIQAFNAEHPYIITHSKIYRSPERFADKKVIVVGSGASGLDIGTQISYVCKKPLLCSIRSPLPQKISIDKEEVPPIAEFLVEERGVRFEDGRVETGIDAIVYCTGYFYSYPFLKSLEPPVVTNGSRTIGLYQYIFDIAHPTLALTALPQKVIPFPISEVQGAVVAAVWANRLELPVEEEMRSWEKKRVEDAGDEKGFLVLGYPQDADYLNGLHDWLKPSGFKKEPAFWGPEELWCREIYAEVREKWVKTGGTAKSLEELGFKYEGRNQG